MLENETITIPVKQFLEILWGYRKSDMRDKCVPDKNITEKLRAIPGIESAVYFQERSEGEGLTIVWQLNEWRRSGLPEQRRAIEMEEHSSAASKVIAALRKKIPLDDSLLSPIAHQIVHDKNYDGLKALGISREELGL